MKNRCDELSGLVRDAGDRIWSQVIHSGKEQWQRDETLSNFRALTAGKLTGFNRGVLIATDVAARGLDIPGVAMVVVYDFGRALNGGGTNSGVESFVHRIGRTGRAGKIGRAFTFFTEKDMGGVELVQLLRDAGQDVPRALEDLAASEADRNWKYSSKKKGKGWSKG